MGILRDYPWQASLKWEQIHSRGAIAIHRQFVDSWQSNLNV
jgi:hypothetical protein